MDGAIGQTLNRLRGYEDDIIGNESGPGKGSTAPGTRPSRGIARVVRFARKALGLVEKDRRLHWGGIALLAAGVSVMEALGALLVLALLEAITGQDASIVLPILGDLSDLLPGSSRREQFFVLAGATAAFFVLRGLVVVAQSYFQARIAWNTGVRISSRLHRGYLLMPYSSHTARNSSELVRNCLESVNQIVNQIFMPAVLMVSETLVAAAILAILIVVAPVATLLAFPGLALVVLVLIRIVQPRMEAAGLLSQAAAARTYQAIQQSLAGIREIRVLGRERYFDKEFIRHRRDSARAELRRTVLMDTPRAALETSIVLVLVAAVTLTIARGTPGESTLSVLGLFAYAVLRMMPSANRLLNAANVMRFGAASLNIIDSELKTLQQIQGREMGDAGTARPLGLKKEVALDDVTFRYDDQSPDVVRGVNLRIRQGQSVGLVGPTGGGKSTLIDLILGLHQPTRGRILVDGQDLRDCLREWQASIGVVHQAPFLLDDTLRRNVALGVDDDEVDNDALLEAIRLANLEGLTAELPHGLDTLVGERGMRLSGGQRQRVAIARALYRRPSVLIFDEGTSSLDNVTEAAIIDSIDRLRGNRTIITVAHRLSTVRDCEWVAVIEQGEVTATGTFDALLQSSASFRAMVRED